MAEPPRSTPALEETKPSETPCLNCGYDGADLDKGDDLNCPECDWPTDRKPGLLRPVGAILSASGLLTFGGLLFLWNSLMVGFTNAYSSTITYPLWHASFYFFGAILLWILAIAASIIAPLKAPRLRHRRKARLSTIRATVIISIILPVIIVGGLLAMAL